MRDKIQVLESEIRKLKDILRREKANTNKLHSLCSTQMELLTEFEKTASWRDHQIVKGTS